MAGVLFPETTGFMIAIQNQVISTNNYAKYFWKFRNLPTICREKSDTIQPVHVVHHRHNAAANTVRQIWLSNADCKQCFMNQTTATVNCTV
jgi:hypothetical protein